MKLQFKNLECIKELKKDLQDGGFELQKKYILRFFYKDIINYLKQGYKGSQIINFLNREFGVNIKQSDFYLFKKELQEKGLL